MAEGFRGTKNTARKALGEFVECTLQSVRIRLSLGKNNSYLPQTPQSRLRRASSPFRGALRGNLPCKGRRATRSVAEGLAASRMPFREHRGEFVQPIMNILRIRPTLGKNNSGLPRNPSVRPMACQLPFQGSVGRKTSPARGGGPRVAWRRGFAVRRIPLGKPQANS